MRSHNSTAQDQNNYVDGRRCSAAPSSKLTDSNRVSILREHGAFVMSDTADLLKPELSSIPQRSVPLERYIAAREQCLRSADEILYRPLGRSGVELVIG